MRPPLNAPSGRCTRQPPQAQFFFGEADFFSAKRLFLRAARDVSGVRSSPLWARVVIKLKMSFQALSHLSSHARALALTSPPPDFFISFIPQNPPKIHPKIQTNPSPNPYIYIVCTHPRQKNQKNICQSPKKALTLHSQNRKRRTCSQAKAGQKPTKSQTAKIFSKKALKICTVQIKVVILHHFRLAKKSFPVSDFFEP